jgi:hypothetical protein
MIHRKKAASFAGLAVALLAAAPASAQTTTVACDDATVLPNPVFLAGSSAIEAMLAQFAVQVRAKHGISIIYSPIASCNGVTVISDSTQVLSGTAHYYTVPTADGGASSSSVVTNSCAIPSGTKALVGVADVSYDSCMSGAARPDTIGEWKAMVQSMLLVVPEANVTTTAMSMEQAAAIWGCGAKGNQTPFVDETAIQQRNQNSGTQIMVAKAIGVPETAFKGVQNAGTGNLITSLLAVPNPQIAIGFVAADAYATKRSTLNAVAFRGRGQTKAYYADSDANAVDKKNVRDGHYVIQGPLHLFAPLTAGQPSAPAKQVIDWITGAVPIDPADSKNTGYITTVAAAGNVPPCAMKVQLDKDGGNFSPYTPPVSCNCFFDQAVTKSSTPPAGCVACTTDSQCSGGKRCQTGFCE